MKLTIPGEMTDLNTFIKQNRANKFAGANVKKEETDRVVMECMVSRLQPVTEYPVRVRFTWYSKNAKKDIDNIAFAKKFILDGLVEAGILMNDSRKFVVGFTDDFEIDTHKPRVEVEVLPM